VVGTTATLLLQIVLARLLGVQWFGDYMYVISWIGLLSLAATLGLDTAALRYVAEYATRGTWELVDGFLRRSLVVVAIASTLLSLVLMTVVAALGERLSTSLAHTFYASALLLPALALLLVASGVLRGLKHVMVAMLPQWLLRPVLLVVGAVTLAVLLGTTPSPAAVMLMDGALSALLFAGLWHRLRRHRRAAEPPNRLSLPPVREWIATSLPIAALTAIRMTMSRVDILLVGALLGTSAAGIYAAPAQMSILISFGLAAVNMISAPLFAELRVRGEVDELQRVVTLGTRGAFLFSLVVGGFLVLLGPFLLRLYGPEFAVGFRPLVILVLSQIIGAAGGSVGFLLSMTGNERLAAWLTAMVGFLNLLLNLLLIPRFGLMGAAVATGIANVAWTAALAVAVRRRIGVRPTVFGS
jgi:O-antigen/teichoic acid export membrane protein